MANPTGKNQYTGGAGKAKTAAPKKPAKVKEVLPPGYVRKGSSIISPEGVATYRPLKKVAGNPHGGTVALSAKRANAIFGNKYN